MQYQNLYIAINRLTIWTGETTMSEHDYSIDLDEAFGALELIDV